MKNKITNAIVIIFMIIFGAGISFLLFDIISANGIYPSGSDTMYHVFRGDLFYRSLFGEGIYPLYNRFWYNGIEPMRYNPPLAAFVFAICELGTAGDVYLAYIFYVIVVFLLGLISFTFIGFLKKRPGIGLVLGLLWFFLPNNIHTLFVEGNLARSLAFVFLPLIFYALYQYLDSGRIRNLVMLAIALFLLIMCHLEFAKMTVISIVAFLVIYRFYQKRRRRIIKVLLLIPIVYLMAGIFLYPYSKGVLAEENEEFARNFFQNILISLNPVYRIHFDEVVYFGISLFVIAILGTLASNKRSAPGFLNAIFIVLLSGMTAYPIIQIVPGAGSLLMIRYYSLALCFIFMGILFWDKLKKWALVFFVIVIAVDSAPGLTWLFGKENYMSPQKRLSSAYEETLIKEAQELCKQRIALFDLSSLGAEGAYLISNFGDGKMSIFGSGWQESVTFDNTKRLNSAMSDEYFDYLFDRCIELGADTVIIQKDQAAYGERTLVKLDRAAERLGYDIIYENDGYMLYHLDVEGAFGTTAVYDAIGIGSSAYSLSLAFPNIKETSDPYLDHYSYDYLRSFKTVYLSEFFCDDREKAENLVLKLSENGVRVVILADGIPEDRETRSKTFLGVTCNVIQFENGYPILYTRDFGEMDCDLFPVGYSKWVTYYLNGLKGVNGTISDNSVELAFYGTGQNENICYIGLNIPFYYYLTLDSNAEKLMQWVMGMDSGILPQRTIHPLNIDYYSDRLVIDSQTDYINTGLAFHDNFVSDRGIYDDNHLMVVRNGKTVVRFVYPYIWEGLIMSAIGLLLMVIYMVYCHESNLRDEGTLFLRRKDSATKAEDEDLNESVAEEETKEKPENYNDFDIPLRPGDDFDIPFGKKRSDE